MKKITNKSRLMLAAALAAVVAVITPVKAFAAEDAQNLLNQITPSWAPTSLTGAIQVILSSVLAIVLLIALVMLIIGGIRYTTSSGNADAVKGAKNQILYAIIGVVVVVLSFAVVQFIFNALPK